MFYLTYILGIGGLITALLLGSGWGAAAAAIFLIVALGGQAAFLK